MNILDDILSKQNKEELYKRYYPTLNQVFNIIKLFLPELKCSAILQLSTKVNISKIGNTIHIEPPDGDKGCYNSKTNTIEIHPWCVEQYLRGNCEILHHVLIHEMIHACGEKDEVKTIQKTESYYSKLSQRNVL